MNLSLLIYLYCIWNYRKTIYFPMISKGIKLVRSNSLNIRSEISRRSLKMHNSWRQIFMKNTKLLKLLKLFQTVIDKAWHLIVQMCIFQAVIRKVVFSECLLKSFSSWFTITFLQKNPTAQHGNTTVRGAIIIESFYPYHNTLPFISTFQSFFNPPVDSQ